MADAKYSSLSSQRYTSFITEVYPPCGLHDDNSPLLSSFLSPIDAKVRDLSTPSRYIVLADQSPPRRVLIKQERASLTRFEIFRSRPGHVPSRLAASNSLQPGPSGREACAYDVAYGVSSRCTSRSRALSTLASNSIFAPLSTRRSFGSLLTRVFSLRSI